MSVVAVGLQHRRASLDVLEGVTVGEAELGKVLGALGHCANLQEAVLLSTCLRTEVYAVVDRFHDAVAEIEGILAARVGVPAEQLAEQWDVRFDDDVAAHLFAVASGLESAVPGESEVQGQVRRAREEARREGVSGPVLEELFRHAVVTGKRVRSETAIGRGTTSFAHAALQLAESRRPGGLSGCRVVVAGAGTMGSGLVRALAALPGDRRPGEVVVVSRRRSRADGLAAELGDPVVAAELAGVATLGAAADVIFTALDVDAAVLGPDDLSGRGGASPLLVLDMGVPRNVDSGVRRLDSVTVCDMGDLRAAVGRAFDERRSEVERSQRIVEEEIGRYRQLSRARAASPVVAALRDRMEERRAAELGRRRAQHPELTDEQWQLVEATTRSVLGKLVHEPTVVLKESAGTPRGERLVEALRMLFDL